MKQIYWWNANGSLDIWGRFGDEEDKPSAKLGPERSPATVGAVGRTVPRVPFTASHAAGAAICIRLAGSAPQSPPLVVITAAGSIAAAVVVVAGVGGVIVDGIVIIVVDGNLIIIISIIIIIAIILTAVTTSAVIISCSILIICLLYTSPSPRD